MQKIDTIRTSYANLLGLSAKKDPVTEISLLPPATQAIPTFVDGFTRLRDPVSLDNPFTPEKLSSQISLSVFNRPSSLANLRPRTAYTEADLVRKIPGWKPPAQPKNADGEVIPMEIEEEPRVPLLPEFNASKNFDFISKNAMDSCRQQQLEEIHSIRDFLARPHIPRAEKDKAYINIPHMKTFERAIMMPGEH